MREQNDGTETDQGNGCDDEHGFHILPIRRWLGDLARQKATIMALQDPVSVPVLESETGLGMNEANDTETVMGRSGLPCPTRFSPPFPSATNVISPNPTAHATGTSKPKPKSLGIPKKRRKMSAAWKTMIAVTEKARGAKGRPDARKER
jgi:hypothetical protein